MKKGFEIKKPEKSLSRAGNLSPSSFDGLGRSRPTPAELGNQLSVADKKEVPNAALDFRWYKMAKQIAIIHEILKLENTVDDYKSTKEVGKVKEYTDDWNGKLAQECSWCEKELESIKMDPAKIHFSSGISQKETFYTIAGKLQQFEEDLKRAVNYEESQSGRLSVPDDFDGDKTPTHEKQQILSQSYNFQNKSFNLGSNTREFHSAPVRKQDMPLSRPESQLGQPLMDADAAYNSYKAIEKVLDNMLAKREITALTKKRWESYKRAYENTWKHKDGENPAILEKAKNDKRTLILLRTFVKDVKKILESAAPNHELLQATSQQSTGRISRLGSYQASERFSIDEKLRPSSSSIDIPISGDVSIKGKEREEKEIASTPPDVRKELIEALGVDPLNGTREKVKRVFMQMKDLKSKNKDLEDENKNLKEQAEQLKKEQQEKHHKIESVENNIDAAKQRFNRAFNRIKQEFDQEFDNIRQEMEIIKKDVKNAEDEEGDNNSED